MTRTFCAEELAVAGWQKPIAQVTHTFTAKQGTVRGMHYQREPHSEMKLVSCLHGEIWDVAVDLRADSPSFLQWHAEVISAKNCRAILIPEGFAHGFQALTDDVQLLYCHSMTHNQAAEAAVNAQDPRLMIKWPLPISELSIKDANHPYIDLRFERMEF